MASVMVKGTLVYVLQGRFWEVHQSFLLGLFTVWGKALATLVWETVLPHVWTSHSHSRLGNGLLI